MKVLLYYLAQVIVTSGILYAYYHFALRNKKFHRYNRFYLLAATVISITIPFLNIPVYFTQTETDSSFVLQTLTVISSPGLDTPVLAVVNRSQHISWFSWQNLSYFFYILIASIALLRVIISLIKIRRIAKNNPVEQLDSVLFIFPLAFLEQQD
jgi:cytochrome c biogenesis factor